MDQNQILIFELFESLTKEPAAKSEGPKVSRRLL